MSALSPQQLQETEDLLTISIYTRSAAKWAQTLKAGDIQGLIRNRLSLKYDMNYSDGTLCDWNWNRDVLLWVVDWVFNIMNVRHWGRLEQDCITAYPPVTHKIEMCLSRENPGAKMVNKINVQCVRINEHVLGSYITWGNKKTAQLRFLWVIGRNTGSYFYYLIAKESPIFLSEFIKENCVQVPRWGMPVWELCVGPQWENHTFHPHKKDGFRKSWNTNHIYKILFSDFFIVKFKINQFG